MGDERLEEVDNLAESSIPSEVVQARLAR